MVSERLHYWRFTARGVAREASRLTYPEALYDGIAPLLMSPDEVRLEHALRFMDLSPAEFAAMMAAPYARKRIESEFKYFYSMFETERRVALDLIERSRKRFGVPSDLMLLFRIVDLASHCALAESELVGDHLDASEEDIRRYRRVVSEAYRAVDQAVGQIMDAFGSGNVVIVSDHGFALETSPRRREYQHLTGPAGIFLAAGPAFRKGRVSELTVYDVLPLLAYLKGFPVATDLEGRLPRRVFDPSFFQGHPAKRVASYGQRAAAQEIAAPSGMDEALLERLRAVGYLQ
jgi:arylsulfatase A-like enzyme